MPGRAMGRVPSRTGGRACNRTWTMPNGDQVFATYEGKGVGAGKLKGSYTIIGGTGKYSGISGGGDEETFNVPKPAMKGSVQGYAKWTGTWKLPTAE